MINKIFLLKIFLFSFFFCQSQTGFEFYSNVNEQLRWNQLAKEDQYGNYILPVQIDNQEGTSVEFIKLNSKGELLSNSNFSLDSFNLFISEFFLFENKIIVLASILDKDQQFEQQFWVGTFDLLFNLQSELFFDPLGDGILKTIKAIIENEETIVMAGAVTTSSENRDFGCKLFLDSNTFDFSFIGNSFNIINDLTVNFDSTGYVLIGGDDILFTNEDFDLIDKEENFEQLVWLQSWIAPITDSTFLITGRSNKNDLPFPGRGIVTGIFDDSFDEITHSKIFSSSEDTLIYPANNNAMDRNNDFIYVGGTFNVDLNNIIDGNKNSAFLLTKLDNQMNQIWRRNYRLDSHYYYMAGVLATSDGGCLMYGHRFTEDNQREATAIKVNKEGEILGTSSIISTFENFNIFPNPFQTQIVIQQNNKQGFLKLYDLNGRLLFNKKITDSNTYLDLSKLLQGSYFYTYGDKNGWYYKSGTLIKQN